MIELSENVVLRGAKFVTTFPLVIMEGEDGE